VLGASRWYSISFYELVNVFVFASRWYSQLQASWLRMITSTLQIQLPPRSSPR
jgi:hypothetical protein